MSEHTPTPWELSANGLRVLAYLDKSYIPLCSTAWSQWQDGDKEWPISKEEYQANAAFIIRACNSHQQLLEACKVDVEWLEKLRKWLLESFGPDKHLAATIATVDKAIAVNKAAIAAAKGELSENTD